MADDQATTRPLDRVFDALRVQDRRRVLHLLATRESREWPSLRETMPPGRDETTYLTHMRHTHLPKLAEYGYLEYDADSGVLRPGSRFDEIAPVVDHLFENRGNLPGEFP